jgi:hypothetical protein
MKTMQYLLVVLMAGVLALAGCGKSNKQPARTPGVPNVSDLLQAFPNPSQDVTTSLDKIRFASRYGQWEQALVELDKLSNMPNLTDEQKKAINDVIEQVKEAIKVRPNAPPQ